MPTNHQLWQMKTGEPGAIKSTQTPTTLEDNQILVKVHTWAVNPCDALLQDVEISIVKYPVILGQDIAGTVEAIGSTASQKFAKGDKVFGFTINNGFQEYAVLDFKLAAKIPPALTFTEASVFGLCCTTSAYSLFSKDHLGLPMPKLHGQPLNKLVLIWGGSSAVGSNAIQLAKGAGLKVITTCSPRSFDYVKSLGADSVYDYGDPTTIDQIVEEVDHETCAGIYLAAGKVADACQVSAKSKQKLFVSSTNPLMPGDCPEGVEAKMAYGSPASEEFEAILPATFGGYMVEALNKGVYKVAPVPEVVNTEGVEGIQEALDLLKKGVSATKLVVEAN